MSIDKCLCDNIDCENYGQIDYCYLHTYIHCEDYLDWKEIQDDKLDHRNRYGYDRNLKREP